MIMRHILLFFIIPLLSLPDGGTTGADRLKDGFRTPPDSIRTGVYWYWINNNISKEGVVKDLEAMKKVGIDRAFIGNQSTDNFPYGDVKLFSDEWWDITHQAMKTAGELGIEIGMFNCPGWSQSGGPWITPEQSMKYVEFKERQITGDGRNNSINVSDVPLDRIISVLAYPAVKGYSQSWMIKVDEEGPIMVTLHLDRPFIARTLSLQCDGVVNTPVRLNKDDGRLIASFVYDRHNIALNTGFKPFAPWVETLPETPSDSYVIYIDKPPKDGITVTLSEVPAVERYID